MGATSPEHSASYAIPRAAVRIFRSPAWAFVLIFLLSFAIRATLLASWADTHEDFYRLRGETGRVALSLLRTGQFADPYMIPTGPTAHPTPLWPALLYLIYHAFGMTATAGYVRGLVAISSYSALYGLLPWLGRRLGLGTKSGVLAGVAGALIPQQGMDEIIGLPALTAPGRAALLIPLATFPLVYYFVSYVAHYPAPLAWMLLLLASYEVQSRISRGNHNRADPTRSA